MLPLAITRRKMLPSPLGDGVGPSNHDRFRGYLSVHLRSGLQFPCLRFAAAVTERHARLGTRLLARPCRGCHFRRLCLTSFQGATPTDPDVRVLPHPAPRQMASLRARGRVDGRHSRERVSHEEAEEPLPRHRSLLRPTVEPLLPDVDDVKAARRQARGVPRNPVVGTVPTQLRHQHPMLLGNRRVAVHPAPAINGGQSPPEAVLRRLSLEHPAAGPGESPVVREPQNVERAGWWESVTVLPRAPTTARSAERDQTTLHRVPREAKAPEAFRQHVPHPWASDSCSRTMTTSSAVTALCLTREVSRLSARTGSRVTGSDRPRRRQIYKAHPTRRWRTSRSRARSSQVHHTSYLVPVRRPTALDWASSRPHLAMTPLPFS